MLLLLTHGINAQWHDANWVIGGSSQAFNNTQVIIRFDSTGPVNFTYPFKSAPKLFEITSVSDMHGNLLFFTNGVNLYDRNLDTILNGQLSLPTAAMSFASTGLNQHQGSMFLPWPGDTNLFALLHTTYEYFYPVGHPAATGLPLPLNLYLTVLDKNLNNGLGGVVFKNVSVLNDTMTRSGGGLAVTRHANGRDWWIVMKKHYRNRYHKLLLTPSGVQYMGFQLLGPDFRRRYGELNVFSPDGQVLAAPISENTAPHPLAIMDFDRCSGMLSNFQIVNTPPSLNYSCEDIDFSPNSRYLYANERIKVFQFDLQNRSQPGAVQNSMIQVADTGWTTDICDTLTPLKMFYAWAALAADGKIYYPTLSGCNEMSRLEHPDSAGLGSSMNSSAISFNRVHASGVPYFPNYRLGPLPGSGCDSLTSVHELQAQDISLYPNPASDRVQISASRALNGAVITLFNVQGQQLLQQTPGFGTTFEVQLPGSIKSGIYFIRIQSNEGVVTKKVVLRR
jgi:hypothetical protein